MLLLTSHTFKKCVIRCFIITSFVLMITCGKSDNINIESPTETFQLDLFEQNLIDYVNWGGNAPIGWAYAITQNGLLVRSDGFGNAVQEPDGTTAAMTSDKEINVASVTKFYTAIVVMQLLEELNLQFILKSHLIIRTPGKLAPIWTA